MAQRTGPVPRQPLVPTSARTHTLLAELAATPNVEGCFIGQKEKNGRLARGIAAVCMVREKRPRAELAREQLVPRRIIWPVNSRKSAGLVTDVQESGDSGFQTVSAGPGDMMRAGPVSATVGVALRHPRFGDVITTAGHAVQNGPGTVEFDPAHRPTVRVLNVSSTGSGPELVGQLLRSSRIPQADYALIAVKPPTPARNLYHDVNSLGGLHLPKHEDVSRPFFALTAKGVVKTVVRGVFGLLSIGGFPMRDLILTDAVTDGGDSGCALIDPSFRVAGLLVGFTTVQGKRFSVFMSAFWALSLEQSELL